MIDGESARQLDGGPFRERIVVNDFRRILIAIHVENAGFQIFLKKFIYWKKPLPSIILHRRRHSRGSSTPSFGSRRFPCSPPRRPLAPSCPHPSNSPDSDNPPHSCRHHWRSLNHWKSSDELITQSTNPIHRRDWRRIAATSSRTKCLERSKRC